MIIISHKNQHISRLESFKFSKNQKNEGKYFIESEHLVREALKYDLVETLFLSDSNKKSYHFKGEKFIISQNVANKISDLNSASDVFAIVKFNENKTNYNRVLVLDDVQDPTNLGALIRSACAFNFDSVFCSNGCASFYNTKVLRAAQGYHFRLNLITGDVNLFLTNLDKRFSIVTTFLSKEKNSLPEKTDKIALVLGNEGKGISEKLEKFSNNNYIININEEVDSLNVAISGSIIMEKINSKGK